ncbi:unnamed protein product, partial [Laminaria digitata]
LLSNSFACQVSEKHNTTFVFLEGRARQFVLDHSLEGPTYQHALRKEAKAFRRAHFGPLSPLSWDYEFSLLRLVRKKAADLSGLHDFFSTERFGVRSLRKVVARLTGFHGFFSGKKPTAGVHVAVLGDGPEGSPRNRYDEEGGFFAAVRRWWPWGGPDPQDEVSLAPPPVSEPPGDWRSYGGDPGGRFWLGFRWFSDAKRGTESEEESSGDGVSSSLAQGGGDDSDEGAQQAVLRSRWEQVQQLWAFGREASPEEVGEKSGTEEPPDGVSSPDGVSAPDGESGSPREGQAEAEGLSPASSVPDRRWLSVGWTPWGAVQVQTPDSRKGEGGVVGPALEAQPLPEEASYLQRWWPASSAREVEPAAALVASSVGPASVNPVVSGQEGEEEVTAVEEGEDDREVMGEGFDGPVAAEGQAVSEEQSYLQRWWPARSARGGEPAAAPASSSVAPTPVVSGPEGEEEVTAVTGTDPFDGSELAAGVAE